MKKQILSIPIFLLLILAGCQQIPEEIATIEESQRKFMAAQELSLLASAKPVVITGSGSVGDTVTCYVSNLISNGIYTWTNAAGCNLVAANGGIAQFHITSGSICFISCKVSIDGSSYGSGLIEIGIQPAHNYKTWLTDPGSEKVRMIKLVREKVYMGLKIAKDAVDNPPALLGGFYDDEYSEMLQFIKQFEDLGATVSITPQPLELIAAGNNKMTIIKMVREISGLGLKESKELVDNCPSVIKKYVIPGQEAQAIADRDRLIAAGATVVLR